jgi:hypothetical protein
MLLSNLRRRVLQDTASGIEFLDVSPLTLLVRQSPLGITEFALT